MNTLNQNISPLPCYSLQDEGGCPLSTEALVHRSLGEGGLAKGDALFKARDKHSNQEVFFSTAEEAYEWMLSHQGWILKKREMVNWTFPLEQTIAQECWVIVGK